MNITISPNNGTVLGGQTINISGEGFGTTPGGVAIESRSCTIISWSDELIKAKAPKRVTNGRIMATSDDVNLVVTLPDGATTATATFSYHVTLLDLALNRVRDFIAAIDPDADSVYNYKITPSQILNYQRDVTLAGSIYPQVLVYAAPTEYGNGGQDSPYGFYTGTTHCIAQASLKLSQFNNWDTETRALAADLCRAIMLCREHDPYALNYAITRAYPGRATDPESGADGVVTVEFDVTLKHIATNWNTQTEGE